MAGKSDSIWNGALLGAILGILAYYGLPAMPGLGESIGNALVSMLDSIGEALLNAIKMDDSTIMDWAGPLASIVIGGVIGIIVDSR